MADIHHISEAQPKLDYTIEVTQTWNPEVGVFEVDFCTCGLGDNPSLAHQKAMLSHLQRLTTMIDQSIKTLESSTEDT